MRCIEMLGWSHTTSSDEVINRNMRCIEIHAGSSGVGGGPGLIETWDVLKYPDELRKVMVMAGLIETWDVLK